MLKRLTLHDPPRRSVSNHLSTFFDLNHSRKDFRCGIRSIVNQYYHLAFENTVVFGFCHLGFKARAFLKISDLHIMIENSAQQPLHRIGTFRPDYRADPISEPDAFALVQFGHPPHVPCTKTWEV
jgi:hypothetical protein